MIPEQELALVVSTPKLIGSLAQRQRSALRAPPCTAAALDKAVAIEQSMDGALGWNFDPGESADQALANFSRTPSGVLTLHVQDVVLDLERQLVRVVMGTPTSVGQPLYAAFLIAIEDLVAGLAGDTELPAKFRHRLAGEPQTAFVRPSPNTPSKASLPPLNREKVLPMCPVRSVIYVSSRSPSSSFSYGPPQFAGVRQGRRVPAPA